MSEILCTVNLQNKDVSDTVPLPYHIHVDTVIFIDSAYSPFCGYLQMYL